MLACRLMHVDALRGVINRAWCLIAASPRRITCAITVVAMAARMRAPNNNDAMALSPGQASATDDEAVAATPGGTELSAAEGASPAPPDVTRSSPPARPRALGLPSPPRCEQIRHRAYVSRMCHAAGFNHRTTVLYGILKSVPNMRDEVLNCSVKAEYFAGASPSSLHG